METVSVSLFGVYNAYTSLATAPSTQYHKSVVFAHSRWCVANAVLSAAIDATLCIWHGRRRLQPQLRVERKYMGTV